MIVKGTIKCYIPDRGFGFIKVPDSDDVFFHYTDLNFHVEEIKEKLPVSFELAQDARSGRTHAVNVSKA